MSLFSTSLAVWSVCSAVLLALLAALLALAPRLLLFLAQSPHSSLTPLEAFLALHFALFLSALALAVFLNASRAYCAVASCSSFSRSPRRTPTQPLLVPLSIAATISAFLAWNTKDVGSLSSVFFALSCTIGLWGLWETAFANSSAISETTGADKHTSSFIFGNKAAASSQKKQLRKGKGE
ncbi:hypothetical protein BDN70DRAFT_799262 [Pholiota conissans]|uniref:Uncharacterized protein n=1 Tax=Pholiota conissans TaxID=109636 RepID=A0A9P5ZA62_9AGAR|nr:hypothetical protein BDN70DRAFT_799262 [Pholiota conissans]